MFYTAHHSSNLSTVNHARARAEDAHIGGFVMNKLARGDRPGEVEVCNPDTLVTLPAACASPFVYTATGTSGCSRRILMAASQTVSMERVSTLSDEYGVFGRVLCASA